MAIIPEITCRRCGSKYSGLRNRCPKCGALVSAGARFCGVCGAEMEN